MSLQVSLSDSFQAESNELPSQKQAKIIQNKGHYLLHYLTFP